MARWGKVDFKELKQLEKRLEQFEQVDFDKVCADTANYLAGVLLNKVKKRTPVGVKPTFDGPKTVSVKVMGADGKQRSKKFFTRNGAILEQYWSGYKGGTLRDAWTVLPVEKIGNTYTVTVINPTEYASYVEYGHRQRPGRYVPALGKRLKANWVKGKFMLTISEQELENLTPGVLKQALNDALKGVF